MKKNIIYILLIIFFVNTNKIIASDFKLSRPLENTPTYKARSIKEKGCRVAVTSNIDLNNHTSKVNENFCLKVVESCNCPNIIPLGSVIYGHVQKITSSKLINRNASIKLMLDKIITPDGQCIELLGASKKNNIVGYCAKLLKTRVIERIPVVLAVLGATIPISKATNLNGGVIYAISIGVGATVGAITGAIHPDRCRTRKASSLVRGFEVTPVGNLLIVFTKGRDLSVKAGEEMLLYIDLKNN